jgi:hypothetical protein
LSPFFRLLCSRRCRLTLLLPLVARPASVCRKLPLLFELLLHRLMLDLPVVATDSHRPRQHAIRTRIPTCVAATVAACVRFGCRCQFHASSLSRFVSLTPRHVAKQISRFVDTSTNPEISTLLLPRARLRKVRVRRAASELRCSGFHPWAGRDWLIDAFMINCVSQNIRQCCSCLFDMRPQSSGCPAKYAHFGRDSTNQA